jgi:hypothetical protein
VEYTQPELYKALATYLNDEQRLVAAAEAEIANWKYASEEMPGPIPHADAIGFRDCDRRYPANRNWMDDDPEGKHYKHGFDKEGKLRLIKSPGRYAILFGQSGDILDEIHFHGDERSSFCRHILKKGVTQVRFVCHQHPFQYVREEYEFTHNRCTRCIERGFYIDPSSGNWVETDWTTIYRYENDDMGLLCVYRDMGETLGNNVLLYRRPGSDPKSRAKSSRRRPVVAYAINLPDGDDARHQAVYCDAYGLEMTIDDEWPIDTIVLTLPDLVTVITETTGATSMGTVYAGALHPPASGDLSSLAADGAKWLMLDAGAGNAASLVKSALAADLRVIVRISHTEQIPQVLDGVTPSAERIVMAIPVRQPANPANEQRQASAVREQLRALGMEQTRIIVEAPVDEQSALDYFTQPDIDGVLVLPGDFGTITGVLRRIALHCT